jgi:hypothetical protein
MVRTSGGVQTFACFQTRVADLRDRLWYAIRHLFHAQRSNAMSTITVPRVDVTTDEVSEALRQGLGPKYKVLPGVGMNWNPVGKPRPDHPDMITVGTAPSRLFRAEVKISRRPGETVLHVIAGGIGPLPRLVNRFWIVEKVRRALQAAPGLR